MDATTTLEDLQNRLISEEELASFSDLTNQVSSLATWRDETASKGWSWEKVVEAYDRKDADFQELQVSLANLKKMHVQFDGHVREAGAEIPAEVGKKYEAASKMALVITAEFVLIGKAVEFQAGLDGQGPAMKKADLTKTVTDTMATGVSVSMLRTAILAKMKTCLSHKPAKARK